MTDSAQLTRLLCAAAHPLTGGARDFDPLLRLVGNARLVLLGEASHGTHEFYRARALITKRLIVEKGFDALLVEADWPDAQRVNRYVRGQGEDGDAVEARADFVRFPQWMWRNADVLDFVGWLRSHNDAQGKTGRPVGLYGMDLYRLHALFCATQNAAVVKNAEQYYRAMYRGSVSSWNLRDQHMMDVLVALMQPLPPCRMFARRNASDPANTSKTSRNAFSTASVLLQLPELSLSPATAPG